MKIQGFNQRIRGSTGVIFSFYLLIESRATTQYKGIKYKVQHGGADGYSDPST